MRLKISALFLLELLNLEVIPLLLSLLYRSPNTGVLLHQSRALPFELVVHVFLVLSQLLVAILLYLQLLPLFLLSKLLLVYCNLRVNLLLQLLLDLAFFLLFVELPLLLFKLDLVLVLAEDLLLLKLEVLVNLLKTACEVLLQEFPLLLHILLDLSLYQRILMLGDEGSLRHKLAIAL